jgi:iron complex outermembrane receptor protein
MMRLRTLLALGTSPIALAYMLTLPTAAFAQSTGTLEMEEIVVTGRAVNEGLGGVITAETVSKSRSTVTEEFLQTQVAGQSIMQSINLLPGVSFTNNDPYGSSGGNLRLRSFDGPRISVTFDGMPLNDTGNYALFTNQLLDPEIIDKTTVNLGTTDVDSPTASATGGTINVLSRKPSDVLKLTGVVSGGSFNDRRVFAAIDTGQITDAGTTAFLAGSYQKYDKFKGPGALEKAQFNGKVYQPIGDRDFVSIAFHWNRNRVNNYRTLTTADIAGTTAFPNPAGTNLDYISSCVHSAPHAGAVDNDNLGNAADNTSTASCTNYIGHRVNPSNTGNIRIQSSFHLMDNLQLTVDPNFQYVLATGGTTVSAVSETDGRLRGTQSTVAGTGVDINGDGDVLDSIRVYAPSVTNTYRYGVTASLIYKFMETQAVRASYTLDYGRHRQTGDGAKLDSNFEIVDLFPHYNRVNELLSLDGLPYRFRDRFSIAELNQFSGSYSGGFFDNQIKVDAGIRLPYFHRELNQYCYTQSGTSNAYCTTQIASAPNANGFVTFAGSATQYLKPFNATRDYDKALPNFGLSYRPDQGPSLFYASFSQGLSAPRTDDLYSASLPPGGAQVAQIPTVAPETTDSYEVGYRYQTSKLITSLALWKIDYQNRIVTAYNPDTNTSIARNVGAVELYGFDAEVGFSPIEGLTVYGSASYDHSKLLSNLQITGPTGTPANYFAPTAGKKLVETPDWTFSLRGQYEIGDFQFGAQLKYTGDRFATDVNDEVAPAYTLVDLDARYKLDNIGMKNTFVQVNVTNLFDKVYFGSISSRITSVSTVTGNGFSGLPTYNIGSPRTVQASLHVEW